MLKIVLPSPPVGAIAASAIGQDEEFASFGVTLCTFLSPPLLDGIHCELRRIIGCTHVHGAAIRVYVIDAVLLAQ